MNISVTEKFQYSFGGMNHDIQINTFKGSSYFGFLYVYHEN